jgi:rhomboid family GlyGly-CTERM serine protease
VRNPGSGILHDARRGTALVAALLVLVHVLAGAMPHALRYERRAVLDGEAWRLLSAHLVHADLRHLAWNVLGVLIVGILFARDHNPRQWLGIMLASTAAIGLGFLVLQPELEWYVGFSGVLHGCMAAGLVRWLRRGADALTWLVGGLFAAKLAWEHWAGALPFTAASLSLPVIHEAHTYGAVGGALAALAIGTRRRHGPASL